MFMAVGYEPLPPSFISRNKRGCLIAHNRIRQLLEKSISRCLRVSTVWGGKIVELVNCEHSASIKYCFHLIPVDGNKYIKISLKIFRKYP